MRVGDEAIYRIERFLGIHQGLDEALLEAGLSPDAQNMDTSGGGLAVAKGFVRHVQAEAPGILRTLAAFHNRKGRVWQLLAATDTTLYLQEGDGWRSLRAGLLNGLFASLNYQIEDRDVLVLSNGQDPALIWDGTVLAEAPGIPRVSHLALHYERMWGAGKLGEPDAVYWSRAYDPRSFAADPDLPERGGGMVLVPTWNGGSVRALMTLFGDVVVFKDYDIHRIIGTYPGNYEVRRVHGVVGPVAPRSIVTDGQICYFFGREGLCAFDGVRAQPIADTRLAGLLSKVPPGCAGIACAAIHKGVLYLALPEQGEQNNVVVEYDLARQTYMLRRGFTVDAFLPFGEQLLFASGRRVYVYGQGESYDGAPIHAYWQTPWTDLGRKDVIKTINAVYAAGEGTGPLRITADCANRQKSRITALPIGQGSMRVKLRCRGRRFRLRFENVDGGSFRIQAGVEVRMELEEDGL